MDVILLVWVPYRAGILQGRSYEGHIGFFFDRFVGDVYVPFKKTDGVVGYRAHGAYMFFPHLRSDEMVHPRYFADASCSRICPCRV
jgi:hypothetical protein